VAEQISLKDARMLALAGQGLLASTAPKTVLETIDTMGVLQIDSVNVFSVKSKDMGHLNENYDLGF
jgi:uncharacterized protein YcaQ